MRWIPVGAWIFAAVVAVVVLGFCAYELYWKGRRLRADLQRLNELTAALSTLQADLAVAQARLAAAGLR